MLRHDAAATLPAGLAGVPGGTECQARTLSTAVLAGIRPTDNSSDSNPILGSLPRCTLHCRFEAEGTHPHAPPVPWLRRYARGLTPNPDLACNRAIKFDALLAHARGLGAEALVTGHFARLRHLPGACVSGSRGASAASVANSCCLTLTRRQTGCPSRIRAHHCE